MKRPTRKIIGWALAILGGWGVVIVLLLLLILLITLGAVISSRDNALPFSSDVAVEPIPPQLIPLYHAAGAKYHVPWAVLAGINRVETDFGRDLSVSSAGAIGWMQFEPSTWTEYGVDADGDGKKDPYDPVDAIFSAANYLSASGVAKNPELAVFQYNHSTDYVREVLQLATIYQTWNPLSSDWVWPAPDPKTRFTVKTVSNGNPASVTIQCPPGATVRAIHEGAVVSTTAANVTLDLEDGLTVTIQGIQSTVSPGTVVQAGETLGQTVGATGVTVSLMEQTTPLPVLWFVSPSPPKLLPTPLLNQPTPTKNGP